MDKSIAVKPDEDDLDFDEIKQQIFDYKENLVATLESDNECKLKFKVKLLNSTKNTPLRLDTKYGKLA